MRKIFLASLLCAPFLTADGVTDYLNGQIKSAEGDVVSLMEAMPADKYNFAPTQGTFQGVRTFGTQAKHIATVIYQVSAASLKEKPPVDIGTGDNGPDALRTKEQILAYVKGAFTYAHKAAGAVNAQNQLEKVPAPFGGMMTRVELAAMPASHSFDHYGQMVVYARINGIVPPASLPPPPAAKKK